MIDSVVEQVRVAFRRPNRLATVCGILLGGYIPVGTFFVVHYEVQRQPSLWILVAGGLLFSAVTVWKWAKSAYQSSAKALGFCIMVEGIMTFSQLMPLAVFALFLLVMINGIATGCILALNQRAYKSAARPSVGLSTKRPAVKEKVAA